MGGVSRARAVLGALALLAFGQSVDARPEPPRGHVVTAADGHVSLVLIADRDDDDDDGVPDADASPLDKLALGDVQWVEPKAGARKIASVSGDAVRIIAGTRPLTPSAAVGKRLARFGVQGVRPGESRISLDGLDVDVTVLGLDALDGHGEIVDLARSHASISRTLPSALASAPEPESADGDALRFIVSGPPAALPAVLDVSSSRADGAPLDTLGEVALEPASCPRPVPVGWACRQTPLIRATGDIVDRSHPDAAEHSILAEVGGRLVVGSDHAMVALRVGGPRHTALGPLERYRGRLRVRLVRLAPHGSPPVGGDETGALAIGREEVRIASSLWGQCGIHFGYGKELDVRVVDPPPPHLIAVGCDLGTPASGGEIAFMIDKKPVRVPTRGGQTPTEAAAGVVAAVQKAGFRAVLSPNALIAPGALRTMDVLVRKTDGSFVPLGPDGERPLSSDPTLGACLGEVDLADGLSHFSDFDAVAGTVEERSLVKAFDDGDPSTLEVFVIPSFSRTGRIGESFIYAQGSSMRNAVIIDRAGIRAGARSFALAHELGHILLDMPGHPDDYGVDSPSSLMDADAADPTIFGPRRLSVAECERAIRQSGPDAPVPLLEAWPLYAARKK
jgi:hypothetical protein